jgi:EpsI family protein
MPHLALWAMDGNETNRENAGTQVLAAPTVLGPGWELAKSDAALDLSQFKPAYQNPSQSLHAEYSRSAAVVGLYLGVYRQQTRGHALVSSDNVLVQSKDPRWSVVARSSRRVVAGNQAMTVRVSEIKRADLIDSIDRGSLLVWQVNWVNGTVTRDDYLAKAYGAISRLFGQSDDAAAIVIYTPAGHAEGGEAVLESFWADNFGVIEALLMKNGRAHTVNGREVSS